MRQGRFILPAAAALTPFQQGHASNLCGLYSSLNGLQLALWPEYRLTRGRVAKLVQHALDVSPKPIDYLMRHGIEDEDWIAWVIELTKYASHLSGRSIQPQFLLRGKRATSSQAGLRTIQRAIRNGQPVMVTIWGAYNHATVIAGYTHDRLLLFDSSGFQSIMLRSVGLQHPRSVRRHRIVKQSAATLTSGKSS